MTIIIIIIIIIIIKNECHSNIIVDRLQGCSHSKKLREVKVSHAAVKSFDSCKNAQTVQFSGGVEKCPVTRDSTNLLIVLCFQPFLSKNTKRSLWALKPAKWSTMAAGPNKASLL